MKSKSRLFLTRRSFVAAICAVSGVVAQAATPSVPQVLPLGECMRIAMENNRRRPASRFAVVMAEAQHRQALAGYWPHLTAKAGLHRLDEAMNFIFPSGSIYIPPQTVNMPGGVIAVTVPANSFGPGFPPADIQMPIGLPGQNITTAAQIFPIPEQDIKVLGSKSYATSGDLTWLLYDGGMRKGYREQALGAVQAAKAEVRRTDLEIRDSVERLYYGAVLARQLRQVGKETLARMEVTLELTESLYKGGVGSVNRMDFLNNQVMVETLRSVVATLSKNEAAAEAALAYTMGLPWSATVRPSDAELPYRPFTGNLDEVVSTAYEFNPDWTKLEAGLRSLQGAVSTARSGYYPKVALTGQLHRWWNSYAGGAATAQNKAGWTIGLGVEIPIFNGFLTQNKVAEALARVAKLKEEQILLREGIGLQLRDLLLGLNAASQGYQASSRAMTAARENRELATRAYQSELIETEEVIRAQLVEAMMTAQHLKIRYDHLALESKISLVVDREVTEKLISQP